MKVINGLNYRDWQKRNTNNFALLDKFQQKEARKLGYRNLGWDNVLKSWEIICQLQSLTSSNVTSMFEHKLNKGDIVGAIDLSLLEADQAKVLAQEIIKSIDETQERIDKLTEDAMAKYSIL